MKYLQFLSFIIVTILLSACSATANKDDERNKNLNHGFISQQNSASEFWNIPYPKSFDTSMLKKQGFISVDGNRLVDEGGNTVVLRGVNIGDPYKLDYQGRWDKKLFEVADSWGANVIRIPVHPRAWREKGKHWYIERIDEAVIWANTLGIYLIIDWHSIGNLKTALFQHPMYETDLDETRNFWRDIALRYKKVPTVAVYELFNEPTINYIGTGDGSLGKLSWEEWREIQEELIDIIYVYDNTVIPLVAGFNWGFDLSDARNARIRREGVAYASHPYPQKARPKIRNKANISQYWTDKWGFIAEDSPMILTEIGWALDSEKGAHVPVIHNEGTYGPHIMEYADLRNISWTAWVMDPDWSPSLISDWNFTLTDQGKFFKSVLQKHDQK